MKFSVITVSYNSVLTLRDTMESVLAQRLVEVEYIVVDGASKDGTLDLLREYETKFDGRMLWVSEPDKGLYDAMNKGIQMATGDVVGMLNSDDFFTDEYSLHRLLRVFERESDLDAVYADIHFVHPDNLKKCVRYYSSKVFTRKLMRLGFMPAHPTFYMRKRLYEQNGLYKTDYRICADFELLLRFIFVNRIMVQYVRTDLVTMRIGGASTGGLSSHRIIMREHLRAFKENGVYTNSALLSLRYVYKVVEVVYSRLVKK